MIRIELELQRGEFSAAVELDTEARVSGLFGPSGSGKSSTLLALAGVITPRRGRIEIGGTVLLDTAKNISLSPEKRRVGVVFQEGRLFPHLDVRSNLTFARRAPILGGPDLDEIASLLDLEGLLDRPVTDLSGGQARLVAIGRALYAAPRLLLLDEPLTGLDPALRRRVLAYLLRLKETVDVRMFYVSHHFADFLALVDDMAILRAGRVQTTGSPAALLEVALADRGAGPVETTLTGTVEAVEGEDAMVEVEGARLLLPLPGRRVGARAYVTVGAADVLVSVGAPPRTSARNTLSGTVVRILPARGHLLVCVDVGPLIWAEVTEASREALGLGPGVEVTLLIKASALRGVAL